MIDCISTSRPTSRHEQIVLPYMGYKPELFVVTGVFPLEFILILELINWVFGPLISFVSGTFLGSWYSSEKCSVLTMTSNYHIHLFFRQRMQRIYLGYIIVLAAMPSRLRHLFLYTQNRHYTNNPTLRQMFSAKNNNAAFAAPGSLQDY